MGFRSDEMTACERCGAYIPKVLASFHQCRGSDRHIRPANVPLEQWLRPSVPVTPRKTPPRKEVSNPEEIEVPFSQIPMEVFVPRVIGVIVISTSILLCCWALRC
jgi:hypothetical protein